MWYSDNNVLNSEIKIEVLVTDEIYNKIVSWSNSPIIVGFKTSFARFTNSYKYSGFSLPIIWTAITAEWYKYCFAISLFKFAWKLLNVKISARTKSASSKFRVVSTAE